MSNTYPYFIELELNWPSDRRVQPHEVARVVAYDLYNGKKTWQGESGHDSISGGWNRIVLQNIRRFENEDLPNLYFDIYDATNQVIFTTPTFSQIPLGSKVKITVGESAILVPNSPTGFTEPSGPTPAQPLPVRASDPIIPIAEVDDVIVSAGVPLACIDNVQQKLNALDADGLQAAGLSESITTAIIDWRNLSGGFQDVNDLGYVVGITKDTIRSIVLSLGACMCDDIGSEDEESEIQNLFAYREYLLKTWHLAEEQRKGNSLLLSDISPSLLNTVVPTFEARLSQDLQGTTTAKEPYNKLVARTLLLAIDDDSSPIQLLAGENGQAKSQEETFSNYLGRLLNIVEQTPDQIEKYLKVRLSENDSYRVSLVEFNIETLKGVLDDLFESGDQSISSGKYANRSPFYLRYEEFKRHRLPTFIENFFDPRAVVPKFYGELQQRNLIHMRGGDPIAEVRDKLEEVINDPSSSKMDELAPPSSGWLALVIEVKRLFEKGIQHELRLQHELAIKSYLESSILAQKVIDHLLIADPKKWFQNNHVNHILPRRDNRSALLDSIHMSRQVSDVEQLRFEFRPYNTQLTHTSTGHFDTYNFLVAKLFLEYIHFFAAPNCIAEVYRSMGEYSRASRWFGFTTAFFVGTGTIGDNVGYQDNQSSISGLYLKGELPYTCVSLKDIYGAINSQSSVPNYDSELSLSLSNEVNTERFSQTQDSYTWSAQDKFLWRSRFIMDEEVAAMKLRHGLVLLEWADSLYKEDEKDSLERAEELYKGVFRLHGFEPPIFHHIGNESIYQHLDRLEQANPQIQVQVFHALRAINQLSLNQNYYGLDDSHIPYARYTVLKEAAARFSSIAQGAQNRFLNYIKNMENEQFARMESGHLLAETVLEKQISSEQQKIALHNIKDAEAKVSSVNAAINAKREEIKKHDGYFSQLGEYVKGMTGIFNGVGQAQSAVNKSGIGGKDAVSLGALAKGGTAIAGAGALAIWVAFIAGSYVSIGNIAKERGRRSKELRALKHQALTLAKSHVSAAKAGLRIAEITQKIAELDEQFIKETLDFQKNRVLSEEYWLSLAHSTRIVMRRMIELSTKTAWLAERALSYELIKKLDIIDFDYFPLNTLGVGGTDKLIKDLAELDATHLSSLKTNLPIRFSMTLGKDFPIDLAQLKQTGRCVFQTKISDLTDRWPGTYNHRVKLVSAEVLRRGTSEPIQGLLINQGVSRVTLLNENGKECSHVLERNIEALPISDFVFSEDHVQFELPDQQRLGNFEGCGYETFWRIDIPQDTFNELDLLDVILTFDIQALYDESLYRKHKSMYSKKVSETIVIPPSEISNEANRVVFDLHQQELPTMETNQIIQSIYLFSTEDIRIHGLTFRALQSDTQVTFNFDKSELGTLEDGHSSVLNRYIGEPLAQRYELTLVDGTIPDSMLLAISYTADRDISVN